MTRYLLDTNIISDYARHPTGRIGERLETLSRSQAFTNVIVAAELRYGVTRNSTDKLTARIERTLGRFQVRVIEQPFDEITPSCVGGLRLRGPLLTATT